MPASEPDANFDLIARPYRWLEYLTLGPLLQQARTSFLPRLASRRQALVLGDGDGRFLARLLEEDQTVCADAVDTSRAMLRLLRNRCAASLRSATPRLQAHHEDALLFNPRRPPDLIVTHYFLDCLTQDQLNRLARRLASQASPEAVWLLSDFRIPTRGAARLPARILIRLLYLAFRILTGLRTTRLPNHDQALTSAGFIRIAQRLSMMGILTAELWQLRPDERPESAGPSANPIDDSNLPAYNLGHASSGSAKHCSRQAELTDRTSHQNSMIPLQAPAQMLAPTPLPASAQSETVDPIPDPEPAVPSTPPDTGVFHHEPSPPKN